MREFKRMMHVCVAPLQAVEGFEVLSELRPGDGEIPKMLARLFHRVNQPDRAIAALEQHLNVSPRVQLPAPLLAKHFKTTCNVQTTLSSKPFLLCHT